MWFVYAVAAVIVVAGIFVLGAQYGKQLAAKARAEAETLKQDAERVARKL